MELLTGQNIGLESDLVAYRSQWVYKTRTRDVTCVDG